MSRSRWAAIGAAVAVTLGSGGISMVRAATEVTSDVTPIVPCRLIDTRPAAAFGPIRAPINAGQTVVVNVFGNNGACNIPNNVTAIQVNLTALNVTATRTFVTAYPAGEPRPGASQMNPTAAAGITSNSSVIALSAGGQFALYNDAGSVNMIIDVLAYYTPSSGSDGEPGPPGPAGPTGATGARGPAGPAGADGADGARGPAGERGPAGPQGEQGEQGPAGEDGDDSVPGPQGPAGPAGPAGADGEDGAQGPAGPAGADGEDGAQGPAGPAGADGEDGAQGPAGPAGPAGADGEDGAQGPAGEVGPQGPAGPAGADGADGADGEDGEDGAQGPVGPQGPAGDPADIAYVQVEGPVSDTGNPKTRTVSAVCPDGHVVVGGGFEIESSPYTYLEPPFVTLSAPSAADTWTVTAERGSITRESWSVQAYAICVGI